VAVFLSILGAILKPLLAALVPELLKRAQDVAEDGDPRRALRSKLTARVNAAGWARVKVPKALQAVALCALALGASGCFTRTVYVPDGTPVRLRETVRGAKVWALDASGEPVPGRLDLLEGWYCLPAEADPADAAAAPGGEDAPAAGGKDGAR